MLESSFPFSSKADTLPRLAAHAGFAYSGCAFLFTVGREWRDDPEGVLQDIGKAIQAGPAAGRALIMQAGRIPHPRPARGRFLSRLNVPANDGSVLTQAIDEVIASVWPGRRRRSCVLVQPMIVNPVVTGVIMADKIPRRRIAQYYSHQL